MKLFVFGTIVIVVFLLITISVLIRKNEVLSIQLIEERAKVPEIVEVPIPVSAECNHKELVGTVYDEWRKPIKFYRIKIDGNSEIVWQTECGKFVFSADFE